MVLRAIRKIKQDNERQVREVLSEEGTFELNTKLSGDRRAKTWKEDLFRREEKSLGRVGWGWVGGAWHYLSSREKPMWLEQSEGQDAKREEQEGRGQMLQDLTGQNKISGFYSTCVSAFNVNKPSRSMCAVLSPMLSPQM